ncbi:Pom34p [Saccharomyces cerevisiae YJM1527]|nr:Pom34p [Saccharomyces cerevisiae YJM1443]AJV69395.1 Pom34p [Saccharomyces cerevisiae YJM1527]AJV79130.1 Pom34p [Saccharomyces cerevisiae YJM554]CAI4607992.1 AMM_1a_G0035110.mRNA.1.CDS.1 [Saccharomyces cerevisiae]CAI4625685.1 ATM_1a_G0035840.mRNA.1.CDS.1 [Saccharomyces cerevisiae]
MKIQAGQLGLDDNDVPGPLPDTDSKPSSQSQNDTPMFKLGNFESPVLKELSRRTVNKEMETQRIMTNVIAFAFWNLLVKFIKFFWNNTHVGRQFCNRLSRIHLYMLTFHTVKKANIIYHTTFSWLNAELLDYLFHLLISLNILFSLWKLLSTVKVSDLNLTERQKKLLGVDMQSSVDTGLQPQHPHYVSTSKTSQMAQNKTHIPQTNLKNHPAYLFKGLETPLKARQREMAEEQTKLQSQSLHTKNVFGTLQRHSGISSTLVSASNDNNSPHTPVTRKGYIPSSKYAYMMNSQSPRGKI